MKIHVESSRFIKPLYEGTPPPLTTHTPLSVFDEVTYVTNLAYIYAYKPPTPANELLELGLQKVLAIYREWAGRLSISDEGIHSIFLNDEGVRYIKASADSTLDEILPLDPSNMSILDLHPNIIEIDMLLQVQLTRFTCGSLVVGVTVHHQVADGQATINFLVAWGQACRGLILNPLPLRDRAIFSPREPACAEFQHRGVEFVSEKQDYPPVVDTIIMHKVHFTRDFLSRLKAKASSDIPTCNENNLYTTFESLVAHLWRSTAMARQLGSHETTTVRISINGRTRLNPRVPDDYFGNLVLWAFPKAIVKDLLNEPLSFAAKLIHDAVTKIDNKYFKSFIDYASKEAKEEGLISTADNNKKVLSPNIDVDSWLRFPFYDVDFGGGSPFIFVPSEVPVEGLIFLAPSFLRDGSIDAFVSLYHEKYEAFKRICYSLD